MYEPIAAIWSPKRTIIAAPALFDGAKAHFACSGLTSYEGFDAVAIIADILAQAGTFTSGVNTAAEALEEPLTAAAQHMHDNAPDDFKTRLASREALAVIFIGVHDNVTSLIRLSYRTKKRGKQVVLVREQAGYPNASTDIMSLEFITAGASRDADDAFKKSSSQQALVHPEKTLRDFMKQAGATFPVQGLTFTKAETTPFTIEAP
ncbi:MAG: hypothetical protein ACAH80_02245 [Alphaproteobacteria bacterium]